MNLDESRTFIQQKEQSEDLIASIMEATTGDSGENLSSRRLVVVSHWKHLADE